MKYEISESQVDQIAKAIYKDVAKYIRDHKDEFITTPQEVKKEGNMNA